MNGMGSKWIDRLEKKLGRLAVPNVTIPLIMGMIATSLVAFAQPTAYPLMWFSLPAVLNGEVWRILSFIIMPPAPFSMFGPTGAVIFTFFALYLFWLMGQTLENTWGTFRFNAYLWIAFGLALISACIMPGSIATNTWVLTTVFLAFAAIHPDFQIMLFMIIPVRIKWLALFTWALWAAALIMQLVAGDWAGAAMMAVSMANFFLFFGGDLKALVGRNHRHMKRRAEVAGREREAFHRCSVCGATDQTHPEHDFRYAPGDGTGETICFCEDHLPEG